MCSSMDYECVRRGDFQYCVYRNSLCWEHKGLVLLTEERNLDGKYVVFDNGFNGYPHHDPDVARDWINNPAAGPYRSNFHGIRFRYAPDFNMSSETVSFLDDWSVLLRFDQISHNFFHWMTKVNVAYLARHYEVNAFRNMPQFNSNISSLYKSFAHVLVFRRPATKWQEGYGNVAFGSQARVYYESDINKMISDKKNAICFKAAIIPGSELFLGDGLSTSRRFREMAAKEQGIRVPESERNLITIFNQGHHRKILNLPTILDLIKSLSTSTNLSISVVEFSEKAGFMQQAMQMARTRILVATHGMVLLHSVFMEPGGVVIELDPYQFNYPLYMRIVPQYGHFYMRYEAPLKDTKIQGFNLSSEAFYTNFTFGECSKERRYGCIADRRDADIILDISAFTHIFRQALAVVF